ncbi:IPT/TIG domain-containing protein [Streptomyces sp. NPDC001982]|uniref:IPT/TIG domain-containing protein n=1 Tax=Streptomyces sp. NPDC001982 TaxID=3154405 RepID=UPI003319F283
MAVPVLSSISPSQGPSSGGTTVTLIGTGFTGVTAVRFGSLAATSFTPAGSTQIIAVAPPGASTVTVTVTTGEGTTTTQPVTYTYVGAPTVTALTPVQGLVSGGTVVTVTGTNLSGATAVRFDTTAAASFTVNSATQITAVTPVRSAGAAPVTVITPGGVSNPGSYLYLAAPTLTALTPGQGPTYAGRVITLTGTGLTTTIGVQFGTAPRLSPCCPPPRSPPSSPRAPPEPSP